MDDTDLEKAAARLRQQQRAAAGAAGTPPPPAVSHRDSLPSEASPPARQRASGGWNRPVRPVPTLVELCTRSLCETKLACVSRFRCALEACIAALCLPACLEVASSHLGAFGSTDIASCRCVVCVCVCVLFTWVCVDVGGCECPYPVRLCARFMHSGIASRCLTSPSI
jgi:hypothetical protein